MLDTVQVMIGIEPGEQTDITLFCGAHGGLKDGVGTSGYNIFLKNQETPLIYGHAVELQDYPGASSTRQKLLAQLACEYW